MCGLFGGISSYLSKSELDVVFGLSTLSVFRGRDSSGIYVVTSPDNKGSKTIGHLRKDLLLANELFDRSFYNGKLVNHKDERVHMVMGHARAATLGSVTKENSHPFVFEHVAGCHNGTCNSMVPSNLSKEEENTVKSVDSWNIYKAINDEGLDAVLPRIKHGAYALTWIDKRSRTLNFIRNERRTLFFGHTAGTLYWASEREFLELVRSRNRVHFEVSEVKPFVHYSIPVVMTHVKMVEEDKTGIAKSVAPVVVHLPSNKSISDTRWSKAEWEEFMAAHDAKPDDTVTKPKEQSALIALPWYEDIITSPVVNEHRVLDYYQLTTPAGLVPQEPCEDEVDKILADGCCLCGKVHTHIDGPRCAFFAGSPDNLDTFYYACDECIRDPDSYVSSLGEHVFRLIPKYWRD